LRLFAKLTRAEHQAVSKVVEQYGKFLGLPTSLIHTV
jgi:hypothetical protein